MRNHSHYDKRIYLFGPVCYACSMGQIYDTQQMCPVARSLDILGERWTLLVIRDLFLGAKKFKHFQKSLKGISPNVLADRLKLLEQYGIVERFFYSDHPPRAEYRLTEKGKELRPIISAFYQWGKNHAPGEETAVYEPLEAPVDPNAA